jgi:hypothetical protein
MVTMGPLERIGDKFLSTAATLKLEYEIACGIGTLIGVLILVATYVVPSEARDIIRDIGVVTVAASPLAWFAGIAKRFCFIGPPRH